MAGHEERMTRWDALPAAEACARAWLDPGPRFGSWHKAAREEIAAWMPMLARALDRLIVECDVHPIDYALWEEVPAPAPAGQRKRMRP